MYPLQIVFTWDMPLVFFSWNPRRNEMVSLNGFTSKTPTWNPILLKFVVRNDRTRIFIRTLYFPVFPDFLLLLKTYWQFIVKWFEFPMGYPKCARPICKSTKVCTVMSTLFYIAGEILERSLSQATLNGVS